MENNKLPNEEYINRMRKMAEEARQELNPRHNDGYRTPGADLITGNIITSGKNLNNDSRYRNTATNPNNE